MQKQTHSAGAPSGISAHEVLWRQILMEGDTWSVKLPAEKKSFPRKEQGSPEAGHHHAWWVGEERAHWPEGLASSLTGGSKGADGGGHTLSAIYR